MKKRENALLSLIIPIERDGYLLRRDVATIRAAIIILVIYCAIYLLAKPEFACSVTIFLSRLREWRISTISSNGCALLSQLLTGQGSVKRRMFRYRSLRINLVIRTHRDNN